MEIENSVLALLNTSYVPGGGGGGGGGGIGSCQSANFDLYVSLMCTDPVTSLYLSSEKAGDEDSFYVARVCIVLLLGTILKCVHHYMSDMGVGLG